MSEKLILVPLDGSAESEAALPFAAAMAHADQATVRLVTVVDTQFAYLFAGSERPIDDWVERQTQQATEYLAAAAAGLRKADLKTSSAVLLGDPSHEILREAETTDAGMVVTATHGRGGLQRWALGSVADKVMRLGHRPTLLVRPSAGTPGHPQEVQLRCLLLPLDGSPTAEAAIPRAVELAQASGSKLLLARVEEWMAVSLTRWGGEGAYIPNLAEIEADTTALIQTYLNGVQERIPPAVSSEAVALRGSAVQQIETLCHERDVSLVVMTTHGRGGISRLVLGSTADRLVRDGVPALLIPTAANEP